MDTRFLGRARPAHRLKALTRLVLAATLSAATLGVTAGSAAPATAATAASMAPSTYERNVQHWINKKREARGLPALRFATCPDSTAERWSSYLARSGEFLHQSMQNVLERCDARYAGETLGRGGIAPRRLVRMWMQSDGHRAVLLSQSARRVGVGAQYDAQGRWVVAANFVRF